MYCFLRARVFLSDDDDDNNDDYDDGFCGGLAWMGA